MIRPTDIFTPRQPIDQMDHFSGRDEELNDFNRAVLMGGSQIVVFGDRGVGKTSFANVATQGVDGFEMVPVNCLDLDF